MSAENRSSPASKAPLRDAGMSLAELIVAIGIFTMILTVVGSTAVLAIRTVGGLEVRVDNATQAELGLASASKALRTAVLPKQLDDTTCTGCEDAAVVKAASTEIQFYANLGRTSVGPSLVVLRVIQDPNRPGTAVLEQRTQDPIPLVDSRYTFCSVTSTSCVAQTRTLARSLVWPTAAVFGYYDVGGKLMTGDPLTTAQKGKIGSIDLKLTAQSRPGQTRWRPLTALSRVRLPNVEINVTPETT